MKNSADPYRAAGANLIGKKIVAFREMTAKEMKACGWSSRPRPGICLQLSDGNLLFPQQDEEGNGPGHLSDWNNGAVALVLPPVETRKRKRSITTGK